MARSGSASVPLTPENVAKSLQFAEEFSDVSTPVAIASLVGQIPTSVAQFLMNKFEPNEGAVTEIAVLAAETDPAKLSSGSIAVAVSHKLKRKFLEATSPPNKSPALLEQSSATMLAAVTSWKHVFSRPEILDCVIGLWLA